jgi:hypothetical protein
MKEYQSKELFFNHNLWKELAITGINEEIYLGEKSMLKTSSRWFSKQALFNFPVNIASFCDYSPIALFDSNNIDGIVWPNNEEGAYAKKFLLPLLKNGVHHYIDNIRTELKILKIGETILPITINDAQYENSYVCSPFSYYISYALESMDVIKTKWIKKACKGMFWGLSKLLRGLQMNKNVIVNNWLLSTNLIPNIDPKLIPLITKFLKQLYPQHAIVFRSLDAYTNADLYRACKNHAYKLIASRQIFLTDTNQTRLFETRLFKSDLKLLETSGYEIVDSCQLTPDEIPRLLKLYRDVYINKYSNLNPQLNQHYIQLALDDQILNLKAIKKDGVIDGIAGYFYRNGIMTCPFFGYDKSKPQNTGLYRILSTVLMLEAKKNQLLFHQSAGASMYKKIRKAEDCLEYTAVYDKHLSPLRKIPWVLVSGLFNSVGVFFMKKY